MKTLHLIKYIPLLFLFFANYSIANTKNLHSKLPLLTLYTELKIQSSPNNQELELVSSDKKIEHIFRITISKKDFKNLQKVKNIKKDFMSNCSMTYNNDSLSIKKIELRGKSSMEFKRKSFSVKLEEKVSITKNSEIHEFKQFNLISLSMDQNYFRNKVAFDLMGQLGLFKLFYTYAEVIINGKTQGIYLMVEKPKNYALKKVKADFMLRRNYQNEIKKIYYNEKDSTLIPEFKSLFLKIYKDLMQKEGPNFYKGLSKILDTEQYFSWMAFNYLIGNGDYTDEVFFYNKSNGKNIRFGIIPWDYDDIFMVHPHEGNLIRHISFGNKLAFSSEDALDYKIINNEYSYKLYLQVLTRVLGKITVPVLKETFESTYQELYPYYCKKEILNVSKSDKYGKTDLKKLQSNMHDTYNQLTQKRTAILLKLNDDLSYKNNN